MSQVVYASDARRDAVVCETARKKTPVVLTRRGPKGWTVAKARMIEADPRLRWLVMERPADAKTSGWSGPAAGELVGVSFRRGHKKCLFSTVVVEPNELTAVGAGADVFAVRWPQQLQELQRRAYQRACPPPERRIRVAFGPPAESCEDSAHQDGLLQDLSAGGIRVRCGEEPLLAVNQSVRLTFALRSRKEQFAVDGTFRHCEALAQGGYAVGFQFVGLETSIAGQELLNRIARVVADFQRAAIGHKSGHLRRRRRSR